MNSCHYQRTHSLWLVIKQEHCSGYLKPNMSVLFWLRLITVINSIHEYATSITFFFLTTTADW